MWQFIIRIHDAWENSFNNIERLIHMLLEYNKGIATLFILIWSYSISFSQDTVLIDSIFEERSLGIFGELFTTPHNWKIDSVIGKTDLPFSSLEKVGSSYGPSLKKYWVRSSLQNVDSTVKSLYLIISNPGLDKVNFFKINAGEVVSTYSTGDSFNFHQRRIKHRYFIYAFQLAPGEQCQIYTSIENRGAPVLIRGSLSIKEYFERRDYLSVFWIMSNLGFFIFASMGAIIASFIFQDRMVLYFALYCLSASLLLFISSGYGNMYLWPGWVNVDKIGYLFFNGYFIGLFMMTKSYLRTPQNAPGLDKLLNGLIILILASCPVIIFYHHFSDQQLVHLYRFALPMILACIGSMLIITVYIYWKTKRLEHLLFLIGFLFGLLAVTVFAVEHQGWLKNIYSTSLALLCLTLDFCIMIALIIYRIYKLRNENQTLTIKAYENLKEGDRKARAKISRNMHDEVLTDINTLKDTIDDTLKDQLGTRLQGMVTKISTTIRDMMHDIHPKKFDREDFLLALRGFIQEKRGSQHQYNIQFIYRNFDPNKLTLYQQEEIYYIIKELTTNTLKHAQGDEIFIRLENEKAFKLTFMDNGKGFDVTQTSNGIGLENIKARAILLNGELTISADENGSTFTLTF